MGYGGWPDATSRSSLDAIIAAAEQEQVDPNATVARSLAMTCRGSHCPSETATGVGGGFESLTLAQHQAKVANALTAAQAGNWSACVSHLCHTTGGWPQHDGLDNVTKQYLEYIRDHADTSGQGGQDARARAIQCLTHCPHWVAEKTMSAQAHRVSVKAAYDRATEGEMNDDAWAAVATELDHAGSGT